jgi:molybdate transport system substrate-binding protein
MKSHPNRSRLQALALVVAGLLWACSQKNSDPLLARQRDEQLVVFAAASLREAFGKLADEFRKSHAGVNVAFNFAGTQEIRTQLEQGAVVDVFAAADMRHMTALRDAGKVEAPTVFAENELVIVVTKEQGASLKTLADLPRAQKIVLGAAEVPIGKYTLQMLDQASSAFGSDFRARVEARVVSRELNVRQVLAKVNLGEADAGIVYRSDLVAAGQQSHAVEIPSELNVSAKFPIAVVHGAPHGDLARQWIELALSVRGREILRSAGFQTPAIAEGAAR